VSCILVSGCWAVRNYTVQVKIAEDGSYRFFAEGLAVHMPTVIAMRNLEQEIKHGPAPSAKGGHQEAKGGHGEAKGGGMKPEDIKKRKDEIQDAFKKEIAAGLKETKITMEYLTDAGDGRARFALSAPGTVGGTELIRSELMVPLSLVRHPDGSVTFKIKDVIPSANARMLDITPTGDISITLAEGIQVLATNAQRKPTTPRGAYRWRLDSRLPEVPFMTIRLPGQEQPAPAPQKELVHRTKKR
jgi:hypothetical protein